MGHALLGMVLPGVDTVHKVSIIPRGIGALGYTIQRPTEDRFIMTREELENRMAVLLGGRAAEQVVFGQLSTGAADDLAKATDIARDMVMRYGMEEKLGPVSYEHGAPDLPQRAGGDDAGTSGATARRPPTRSTRRCSGSSNAAFARAVDILSKQRTVLEHGAALLLEHETLDEAALKSLRKELAPLDSPVAAQ